MECWNNGKMEQWENGLKPMEKNLIGLVFEPIIPIFHHSDIPSLRV
jgi:hypothetical protein